MRFSYARMTSRNIGFVTPAEQARLRRATAFVCGAGGMGGSVLQCLVRAGVGGFEIADFDTFEISNLNRQVFASLRTIGRSKTVATAAALRDIQPALRLRTHGAEWRFRLAAILRRVDVVVNAADDVAASIQLYRSAAAAGVTVIDAYTSVLPSVYVTRPTDPRPETRLRFGTVDTPVPALTPRDVARARFMEMEHVLAHSSTLDHVDRAVLEDVLVGRRPRISFAPMVLTSGNLMAYEAIRILLGRDAEADCRGYFFNPYRPSIERQGSARLTASRRHRARAILRPLLARVLRSMSEAA